MDYSWVLAHTIDDIAIPGETIGGTVSDIAITRADDIVIADGASDFEVDLGIAALGKVKAFALTADAYHASLFTVKYAATANPANPIIDAIFFGPGNVSMMDFTPQKLFFANGTGADIKIQVVLISDPT